MLTFAEEILVLLLDEKKGTFLPLTRHTLDHALVGAVLMDLAFAGRIDTDATRLMVVDPGATGTPMLDGVLERIVDGKRGQPAVHWLEALSGEPAAAIREQALHSLVQRGIIERRDEKILWVFRTRRYPLINGRSVREAKLRISELLYSDRIPDPRDIALICLADACGVLPSVFEEDEIERGMPRLRQLRKMDLIGRELVGLIATWKLGLIDSGDG